MIVRSANEQRLSNFLLWDSAYAELAFYEKLWPDWDAEDIQRICEDYGKRVRKFGGVQ
jgi:undecaprenyl diphosphate synthase